MTNKSIATALTFGFLAFTLSVLPVTTAEAGCYIQRTLTGAKPPRCEGNNTLRRHTINVLPESSDCHAG
jgi:hypothetical protein